MKLRSILLLIHLHIIYTNAENGEKYEPHMAIKDIRSPAMKKFRFDDLSSLQDTSYITMHMCPAETETDIANLEYASQRFYKMKYCLFKKVFLPFEDRYCQKEVKPVLHEVFDVKTGKINQCSYIKQEHIRLHAFSFYLCGETDVDQFQDETTRERPESWEHRATITKINYVCYDTIQKKVLWTRHSVTTAQLFQNPYLQNARMSDTEISTDPYFMNHDVFLNLKKEYGREMLKNTSTSASNYRMTPRPLVPPEHFVFLHWKKATSHYMNMAPLWEKLVPLVTAIDEGIKKAQLELEIQASKANTSYDELSVLTNVTTIEETDSISKKSFNLKLFESNIWYKFVYRIGKKTGVLIVVHNTPGKAPSNGCLVGKKEKCDFRRWTEDEEIRRGITDEMKTYAYCCNVKSEDVMKLFYDFAINGYFEIDSLITKGKDVVASERKSSVTSNDSSKDKKV